MKRNLVKSKRADDRAELARVEAASAKKGAKKTASKTVAKKATAKKTAKKTK